MISNQPYNNQYGTPFSGDQTGVNDVASTGIIPAGQSGINPAQLNPTPISPTAFSNQRTINGVYGNAVPGTFNRSNAIQPPIGVQTSITPNPGIENQ